ncbi:MAG TPA: gamma-glutamylcyclotransferase family protein [Pyrinomonadaceae bacterium]|nr:gamma-glutamylcyclotransferase family protein [Pyrinomonadaceae bacterium]
MKDYLFVCGTLRSEYVAGEIAEVMQRLRSLGAASVQGRLHDFGDYPGAVLDSAADTLIHGELFELPHDEVTLAALDEYEDFDPRVPAKGLFVRRRVNISDASRQNVEGWIYVYNGDPGNVPIIAGGKWTKPTA